MLMPENRWRTLSHKGIEQGQVGVGKTCNLRLGRGDQTKPNTRGHVCQSFAQNQTSTKHFQFHLSFKVLKYHSITMIQDIPRITSAGDWKRRGAKNVHTEAGDQPGINFIQRVNVIMCYQGQTNFWNSVGITITLKNIRLLRKTLNFANYLPQKTKLV